MIYINESRYSNSFFGALGILYMPGLVLASVVGGVAGFTNIHDPSFVLASIFNFMIYGSCLFFLLKLTVRPKPKGNQ
jgi:hypothetical protein